MPFPLKIVDVNTATWSDYKNSFCAVYSALLPMKNSVSDGSLTIGHANEYIDLKAESSIAVGVAQPLIRLYVHADKVGNPSFNVTLNAYADDGSGNPDFNNKISSGTTVAAASFSTTAKLMLFTFPMPPSINNALVHYVFKASAAGDASNHVRFYKDAGGSLSNSQGSPNTGTRAFASGTWSYPGTADILRCALIFEDFNFSIGGPVLWAVAVDKTNNKLRLYRSLDNGLTWSEIDSATAPSSATSAGLKSIQVSEGLGASYFPTLTVATITGSTGSSGVATHVHEIMPGSVAGWGGGPASWGTLTINENGAGITPMHCELRSNRDTLLCYQGATETVMGAARRRVKLAVFGIGSAFDPVGSANSPIAGTLPGTATHYDLRMAFTDAEDRLHIFWSTSDTNNIQHRVLNPDNTFSTINTIGTTAAVCSNTSAYPVGLGGSYFKNNEWRIAFPYLDSTSGTIKVAHCKAADSATASAWTIEQVSTDTPEVTTSNLGFVAPDAMQGSKLVLFYVKSDDTVWMSHDGGTGTWTAPTQWRSGILVAGISGFLSAKNLMMQYLDTAPATDELKFDRL